MKSINSKSYSTAIKAVDMSEDEVVAKLVSAGFSRKLTPNQMNNVRHLAPMPAGATFSVPGAGKTTEALAYFFCNVKSEDHLLVVGPLSAMGAWEEQLQACCPNAGYSFVRLRGGAKTIDRILRDAPRFMLISYGQFATVSSLIKDFLTYHSVIMFLDESHRIKSGRAGVSPQEILNVSCLPEKKLIMSGTPCPQSISDLIPQFEFLYPDKHPDEDTGRRGEYLTLDYERKRTGIEPDWRSVETNLSGYDIMSVRSNENNEHILIEVKSSAENEESAMFFISRHEWDMATLINNRSRYYFYLWNLAYGNKRLAIIDVDTMASHIPDDNNTGKWETVSIPFSAFLSYFTSL